MSDWQQHTQTLDAIISMLKDVQRGEMPVDNQGFITEGIALIEYLVQALDKRGVGLYEILPISEED